MKVLLYIDSAVAYGNSITAAEMLRRKLDAQVVLMCVDSQKYLNATTDPYTVFDYSNLFRAEAGFIPVWPRQDAPSAKPRFGLFEMLRVVVREVRNWRGWIRGLRFQIGWRRRQFAFYLWLSLKKLAKWISDVVRRNSFGLIPETFRFGPHLRLAALVVFLPAALVGRVVVGAFDCMAARLHDPALKLRRQVVQTARTRLKPIRELFSRLIGPARSLRRRMVERANVHLKPTLRMLLCHRSIGRFLNQIEPDLIVLAEGNVETLSAIFIAQGRKRGMPTVIVPFTLPNPAEPALFYKESAPHQAKGLLARMLCRIWPKWRLRFEDAELVRLPPFTALFAELLGCSSPAPWVLNRGDAAAIALDSQAQCDQYLRLGFPPTQLHVVGDGQGDVLFNVLSNKEQLRASLYEAHGFDARKPLVLCGFPPNQFDSYNADGFEFSDYASLIGAWTSVFCELKDRANFLVRPHPRMSPSAIELLRSHGVQVSAEATAKLVPLCDVYLASISATIRWAISCGIPVINYDTYRYRYDDFKTAAGVFYVEKLEEFRSLLRRLLTDPEFACEARRRQQSSMEYWGASDGKTSDRMAALALNVVNEARRRLK